MFFYLLFIRFCRRGLHTGKEMSWNCPHNDGMRGTCLLVPERLLQIRSVAALE